MLETWHFDRLSIKRLQGLINRYNKKKKKLELKIKNFEINTFLFNKTDV